jgi:hypothetical protein
VQSVYELINKMGQDAHFLAIESTCAAPGSGSGSGSERIGISDCRMSPPGKSLDARDQ